MILPASWSALLESFRPVFRRRGTFTLFIVLATGLVLQTRRRSVVGMLAAAGMASKVSFHAACRFFSSSVWDIDALCLIAARLIVSRLLEDDAPIVVAIDDTLFKRWGRKVHHAFWTHDGSAQGGKKIARGNRWIIAGIVVRLPFVTAPLCLPVLFRLWAGKGTTTPVELAGELLNLLAAEFPDRAVHGVGDAAYHGKPLLVKGTTWTTRLPANAPPTIWRRRPPADAAGPRSRAPASADPLTWPRRRPGGRSGFCATAAPTPSQIAIVDCIWYGSFGNAKGRCVLVRDEDSAKACDLALFTLDHEASTAQVVERYAVRWSIEPSNAAGKQQTGVGQARNRVKNAVERTVPFAMLIQSMVIVWYGLHGYHPGDITARRLAEPWYDTKVEPSFEDMLTKLRRTLIAARFTAVRPGHPNPDLLRDYALACAAAAA